MKTVNKSLTKNWVLWSAIAAFLLPVLVIEFMVMQTTHGVFAYPVDDTFIHLAIARNLAFYGVWGISPHEFVSASSSIIYPLLLGSSIKIFGVHTFIPFVINMIAGVILLAVMQRWLDKQEVKPTAQLIVLLAVIFLMPLPVLAMSGMEHVLQLLFCFLFLTTFSEGLEKIVHSGKKEGNFSWTVYLYAALLTATRFEGVTLVGLACLLVLTQRRFFLAIQLGLIALLPVLVFGMLSVYKGSYFFPNSVLLKSGAPPLTFDGLYYFFTDELFNKLSFSTIGWITVATQRLLFILPLTYLLFLDQTRTTLRYRYILLILMAGVGLHLVLTGSGRFPRYEAYLIGCSAIGAGVVYARYWQELLNGKLLSGNWFTIKNKTGDLVATGDPITGPGKLWKAGPSGNLPGGNLPAAQWAALFIALFLLFPILIRSKNALMDVGRQCVNIYQQQYQMGRFLGQHYPTTPIAMNDIGGPSFFTSGKNVDMWGLGNIEVTKSVKKGYYGPDFLNWLTKKDSVKVAVVFERYFPPALLERWDKIASWQIMDNLICADDSVSFYAVDKKAGPDLKKNLHAFQSSLPQGVVVRYY
ncbi:hypothetical protein ACX0G9_27525 [Flavitalea flava]